LFIVVTTFSPSIFSYTNNKADSVVNGFWQIEYMVLDPHENLVPVTVNTLGYKQSIRRSHRGYKITVTCHLKPIIIESSITKTVRGVLAWLDSRIPYSDEPGSSQSFDSVLTRGKGNCVGRAEAAVTILKSKGLNCRTVSGCLYKNGKTSFHRWFEVDYPDTGALPSEPGFTQDFVTPYHLVILPSDTVGETINQLSDIGVTVTKTKETRSMWTIERRPLSDGHFNEIICRQTTSERIGSAVVGTVLPAVSCKVRLKSNNHEYSVFSDKFGCFSIVPIAEGSYSLNIESSGFKTHTQEFTICSRELVQVMCKLRK
ncbi:transglutaminase domain-containing protein, partial [bacterium]|nr:transglutaminase domain-containing protein [bacterium]